MQTTKLDFNRITNIWPAASEVVFVIHDEKDYDRAVGILDKLIDKTGGDENHPLASLMELIGLLIEKYEDEHYPHEITPNWREKTSQTV